MDNRREFLKRASILAGGASIMNVLPMSIQKAMAINPAAGSTYLDAEHIVILMQENRSFDHTYGSLQGVRGFNDPRAIQLANQLPVWLQTNRKGDTYAPFHLDIKETKSTWMSSLPHSWSNQVDAWNQGQHDGWLEAKHSGHKDYKEMPLTMGYYSRQDIPFYYALADAFTVCDHNFCSAFTGTTPNRVYFWSGTIREKQEAAAPAKVWNGDVDYDNWGNWTTYPERLEKAGISWKVYQNEISVGVGLDGEQDAWLANFTDNPLEFFEQYNVKLTPGYINNLPAMAKMARAEIAKMEQELNQSTGTAAEDLKKKIKAYTQYLEKNADEQQKYTAAQFDQLSDFAKNIHRKAFTTNEGDPHYHNLETLKYQDGAVEREVLVPKGDVLYQFRKDVAEGKLPTVSWLVAPENFSDHPGAAWYGAWYISEVMDILTKDPEVWKKTIFILAYDENDGYFDHMPPFTVPNPYQSGTGKMSKGLDATVEYVTAQQQSSGPGEMREAPIGLGYRVPLLIASPWSRGGWVCSEVFDHTSTLRFLEKFISGKFGKQIKEYNISAWRRTICGDLTNIFRPYNGEKIELPASLKRDEVVEGIHKAKFKAPPSNFKQLSAADLEALKKDPVAAGWIPRQEKGVRTACALPYELSVNGGWRKDKQVFTLQFRAGNQIFGQQSLGAPFNVYALGTNSEKAMLTAAYTVKAGDTLTDEWALNRFKDDRYHLRVYGPNGFYREFKGDAGQPDLEVTCDYELSKLNPKKLSGNIRLTLSNHSGKMQTIRIKERSYHQPELSRQLAAGASTALILNLGKSQHWYDFSVLIDGAADYEMRYAGHVETGGPGITDPAMGGLV